MKIALCLLAILIALPAEERDDAGTIAIVVGSSRGIVVGADSKMTTFGKVTKKTTVSTTCKVRTLNQHSAFVAVGRDGHESIPHPEFDWNAASIAVQTARRLGKTARLKDIANAWGKAVASHDNIDLQRGVIDTRSGNGGQIGMFAGFEDHHSTIYMVSVNKEASGSFTATTDETDNLDGDARFAGVRDIVTELFARQTERSKQWWSEYNKTHSADRVSLQGMTDMVRWLIEMTIEYSQGKVAVGKPIDLLEIGDSGVRWVSKQAKCPE